MIFNGHTHDTLAQIDEVSMSQIMTMYADGVIGNFQILTVLGQLTAGVFNYIRPANSPDYKLARIKRQIAGMYGKVPESFSRG